MKALCLLGHGGPDKLAWLEVAESALGPSDVRVAVRAAALNHLDLWVRRGLAGHEPAFPHVMGSDMSGVVTQVGSQIRTVKAGDEVIVNPGRSCMQCHECLAGQDNLCRDYALFGEHLRGGMAEAMVVPAVNVTPKPPELSFEEAAALPITYLTAWQMLVMRARVQPLDVVFVHGLSSGVGVAALQIAKLFSAVVIGSTSSDTKRSRAIELGAAQVFDSASDLASAARDFTQKKGVDIVVEHTGKETWPASLRMVKRGGVVVTCGATSGFDAVTDLRQVFYRQVQVLGSTMGPKSTLATIARLAADGALRPVLDSIYPAAEALAAYEKLEARQQYGKIVVKF